MRSRRLLTALLTWTVLLSALPRDSGAAFQVFTTADGLAGDGIQTMLEDRAGNLWFGTPTGGLSRFDGLRWTTFDVKTGLPGNDIHDLIETAAGDLWAATSGGPARWDGRAWRAYGAADGLPAAEAFRLLEAAGGDVWVYFLDAGLARFDGAGWTRHTSAERLAHDRVHDMLRARDGTLWFATQGGVSRFDGERWDIFTTADGLADNAVSHLIESVSGAMWFATDNGLSRLENTQWTTFTTANGLPRDNVDVLLEDDLGTIWAGTTFGLSRFDGVSWSTFTTDDGLADNAVDVAFKDSRGQLWFGSSGSLFGLTRRDRLAFEAFTTVDGLAGNHVSDILQDRQGNLWFATGFPGAGVTRFDGAYIRSWTQIDGLVHPSVLAVEADSAGILWIGTADGLSRFDGHAWRSFTSFDGLPDDSVKAILEDDTGRLWFGTRQGIATFDGATFTTVPEITEPIVVMAQDAGGNVWAGTRTSGAYRYDGSAWTNFRVSDGLVNDHVRAIVQGPDGAMWFGTEDGVSRYDGTTWTSHTSDDGLVANYVHSAARDSSGALWFGTDGGVSRFDGTWRSFDERDGLASRAVLAVHVTPGGVRWFCTLAGASRFDGQEFVTFGPSAGLAGSRVNAATSDGRGRIWFGTIGGLSRLEPDRVAPRAVVPEPQNVITSRTQSFSILAAFGESRGIEFSHAFDGEEWSPFSRSGFLLRSGLGDGPHTFAVRARDEFGNLQEPPSVVAFEVDATPPAPILAAPGFAAALRERIAVTGTAADARFAGFRVEVRRAGETSWNVPPAVVLAESAAPVTDDTLAVWDTRAFPEGDYDLRVEVSDTLQIAGVTQIRVTVDNAFPFVDQTSPAPIVAALGGHVYTTEREVHLFFPPNAFDRDAIVTLAPIAAADLPDSLGPGITRVTAGFELSWVAAAPVLLARLLKPATIEFSFAGLLPAGAQPVLYAAGADLVWRRIGGTVDAGAEHVAATVTGPGRLALFAESAVPAGGGTLSALALTPRVFSPSGSFAASRIAIGFSLGRAAPVTVRVYNRAGRLVREVASGLALGPGSNLVYWDGRDRDGDAAGEGLYLVTVEALDERRTQTLAVVR